MKTTDDTDNFTLNTDVFGKNGTHGGVGRFKSDAGFFFKETLESGKTVFKKGNDNITVVSVLGFFANDKVVIKNSFFDHGVALNLKDKGFLFASHHGGADLKVGIGISMGKNGFTSSDEAKNGKLDSVKGLTNAFINKFDASDGALVFA